MNFWYRFERYSGTDWCATLVPVGVLWWYRYVRYGGTDSSATMVPFRRYYQVTVFNHQVGNTGWSNMRAYHDQALIDEFKRRGIDVSAIYDGKSISFAHSVRYDIADNRFVVSD